MTADEIITLVTVVLIRSRPLHLASTFLYIQDFNFTATEPSYVEAMETFQTAVKRLMEVQTFQLKPKNKKIKKDLSLEELIEVTGEVEDILSRSYPSMNGKYREIETSATVSTLDLELTRTMEMIEKSTQDLHVT